MGNAGSAGSVARSLGLGDGGGQDGDKGVRPVVPLRRFICSERRMVRGGMRVYKMVVLGAGNVGKSALTMQFVHRSFPSEHEVTVEDAYQVQTTVDDEPALLDILDTAGDVVYSSVRRQFLRFGEGFIIVYSVTDRHSFLECAEYYSHVQRAHPGELVPVVLLGTKIDLAMKREVSTDEGMKLAKEWGCPFFEVSAAMCVNVKRPFHAMVRLIRTKERKGGYATAVERNALADSWKRMRAGVAAYFQRDGSPPQ